MFKTCTSGLWWIQTVVSSYAEPEVKLTVKSDYHLKFSLGYLPQTSLPH